ncbi:site-2 protease family protein [Methanoculleus sp.]|uniref:site-2 protease family protein n=1 Tax=Methanoculleus sp. TaxID=90427 RepID=UPI0025DD1716|nr:site-2 protease family protein [Methanoculleus sp.]MCK9318215.1 peptidase M50 [Methanoculleus sp.]MDD2254724.1 peptidase M50 [Methanoculleus sp.]MDD2788946.1 peptidase M50 [Methanoculleus sp.]MDD4315373.1 peptidase M50 [Methanoculleus sp.]MDD4471892.1 peptidase M50 [Methanoculleus sp.]
MLQRLPPRERRDLLIAWLAISIAFTLLYVRGGVDVNTFLLLFVMSLVTVGVAFVLHELAHKFAAMRYGYWAEFQKDNQMLLVAVVMAALVGVVFAAPGATYVYGNATKGENGRISAAGPITNLVLCIPFAALVLLSGGGLLGLVGLVGLRVNAMIATFNMLPISVLDGRKVLAWSPAVFAVLIVASGALLFWSLLL